MSQVTAHLAYGNLLLNKFSLTNSNRARSRSIVCINLILGLQFITKIAEAAGDANRYLSVFMVKLIAEVAKSSRVAPLTQAAGEPGTFGGDLRANNGDFGLTDGTVQVKQEQVNDSGPLEEPDSRT